MPVRLTDFDPITRVEDVTRRELMFSAMGAALLIACGDDEEDEQASLRNDIRVVDTIMGSVEVPAEPHRVVATGFVSTATLLDLGFELVGVSKGGVDFLPEYDRFFDTLPDVGTPDGPDLELIASLDPDVILASDWLDPAEQSLPYEELSAIAPTVVVEWQQSAGNWQEQATAFADAIGRGDDLAKLREEYTSRAAALASDYAAVNQKYTWDLLTTDEGVFYTYSGGFSHGKVISEAGVRLGAGAGQTSNFQEYSNEQLNVLSDTGAIILDARPFAEPGNAALKELPVFQSLEAVKAGQVYSLPWFFPSSYNVALALLREVEAVLKELNQS